jgi:hypothetical protein
MLFCVLKPVINGKKYNEKPEGHKRGELYPIVFEIPSIKYL